MKHLYLSGVALLVLLIGGVFISACSTTRTAGAAATVPTLAADATPTYTQHIVPIFAHSCTSCHSGLFPAGGYSMTSYQAVLHSGNSAPNIRAGDPSSNLLRMLHGETISAGGPMPPAQALSPEQVLLIERWIMAGARETP